MSEPVPIQEGLYRDQDGHPALLGSRCRTCGHIHFPKAGTCLACRSSDVDVVELGDEASLFCETTVHMNTPHFPAGYSVGYVTLPGGFRLFTQLRRQ